MERIELKASKDMRIKRDLKLSSEDMNKMYTPSSLIKNSGRGGRPMRVKNKDGWGLMLNRME